MIRCLALTALLTMVTVRLAAVPSARAAGSGFVEQPGRPAHVEQSTPPLQHFAVALPAFSEGLFPCSDCHTGMIPNLRPRALHDEHATIVLRHAAGQLWCLDCHQPQDRDNLRLATGESIPFTESYRLCGQCHGEKLRDWRNGLHGKRTGYWNGDRQYLLCTHCHNPHDPEFKPLTPLSPPERPGRTGY